MAELKYMYNVAVDSQFFVKYIFECTHLKFTVSGRFKQTSKRASIHTCSTCTMLVWAHSDSSQQKISHQLQYIYKS